MFKHLSAQNEDSRPRSRGSRGVLGPFQVRWGRTEGCAIHQLGPVLGVKGTNLERSTHTLSGQGGPNNVLEHTAGSLDPSLEGLNVSFAEVMLERGLTPW